MLPAAHRLRRSKDFAHTVRRGRRSGRGSVVVHFTIGETQAVASDVPASVGDQPARAGFVVSKAVGAAVVRNKVKRRLRHLMAERIDRLPPGSVLVVRAQPGAACSPYPELGSDLDGALEDVLRSRGRR